MKKIVAELSLYRWFLDLAWTAGRWRLVAFGGLVLIVGLLPTAAILATGALVRAIPDAAAQGLTSSGGQAALLALASLVLCLAIVTVAGNALTQLCNVLGTLFGLEVHERVARVTLGTASVATLEAPAFADKLQAIQDAERRGMLRRSFMGLSGVATTRLRGMGAFVVLLQFRWWAPFLLGAAWHLTNRVFLQATKHALISRTTEGAVSLRRAEYLRSLLIDAPAAKEVRVFGLGDWLVGQYGHALSKVLAVTWRSRLANRRLTAASVIALAVTHGAVLAALVLAVRNGEIAAAALLVYVQAVIATTDLGMIGDVQLILAHNVAVVGHLLGLAPQPVAPALSAIRGNAPAIRPHGKHPPGKLDVRFDRVSFTYAGRDRPTLRDLTLHVPAGQSLAIVGQNGAGKSTVVKLLCGLYEPNAGEITLGGSASPEQARGRIAVIFQDFVRYPLSLRENVGFGSVSLLRDEAALAGALHDAGGDDLLARLPHGWDTVLSREFADGAELSGGEWQRVALARALAAVRGGAGLLILDEPTASLDVRAEKELFERFLALTRTVTSIVVSHRLSSVRHADRIVVIEDGCLIEDGSHDDLMRLRGRYAEMFSLQAERFVDRVQKVECVDGESVAHA